MNQSAAMCTVKGLHSWVGSTYVLARTLDHNESKFFDAQHFKLRPSGPLGSGAYFHARLNPRPCSSKIKIRSNYAGWIADHEVGGHLYSYHYDDGVKFEGHQWAFGPTVFLFIQATGSSTGAVRFYGVSSYTWWITPGPGVDDYYVNCAYFNRVIDGPYPGIDPTKFGNEDNYLSYFDAMVCHPPKNPIDRDVQTGDFFKGRYVDPSVYTQSVIRGEGLLFLPTRTREYLQKNDLFSFVSAVPPTRPCFTYALNELNVFNVICDLDVYLAPYASGLETAYLEAAKTLPSVSGNSIANVVELVQGILSIVTLIKGRPRRFKSQNIIQPLNVQNVKLSKPKFNDNLKGLGEFLKEFKDPRDAWLWGRYCVNTTECDIEEYRALVERCVQLDAMCSETIQAFGQFQKGNVTYNATMTIRLSDIIPKDLSEALRKAGFGMTLSNVWDMIPYSFVVDWFIGVSDVIGWAEDIGNMLQLTPSDIWYSVTTKYSGQEVYFRVPGRFLNNIPALVTNDPSHKTICMRIGDAISLFTK